MLHCLTFAPLVLVGRVSECEAGREERGRERTVAKWELILTPPMRGSTWHAVDGVRSRVAANESSLSRGSPGGKTTPVLTSIIAS